MFHYHFIDIDLRLEKFFKQDGAAENEGVDFEIGDKDTFGHLYWTIVFRANV